MVDESGLVCVTPTCRKARPPGHRLALLPYAHKPGFLPAAVRLCHSAGAPKAGSAPAHPAAERSGLHGVHCWFTPPRGNAIGSFMLKISNARPQAKGRRLRLWGVSRSWGTHHCHRHRTADPTRGVSEHRQRGIHAVRCVSTRMNAACALLAAHPSLRGFFRDLSLPAYQPSRSRVQLKVTGYIGAPSTTRHDQFWTSVPGLPPPSHSAPHSMTSCACLAATRRLHERAPLSSASQ